MYGLLLTLGPLILSFGVLLAGSSLQIVLLGLRAPIEGISISWMGLVSATYFAGFGIGTLYGPRLIRNIGHIRTFAAMASIASGLALLLAFWPTHLGWVVLRLVTGFCYAGLYTVVESWLNARTPNDMRGRLLSVYGVTIFGGLALGPMLANLGDPSTLFLFALSSILISFALVPVTVSKASSAPVPSNDEDEHGRYGLVRLFRETPLGFVGAFYVGALQGSFISLSPVYGSSAGFSGDTTAAMMTTGMLAGLVAQYPLGWLSDRFDRRAVIVGQTLLGGGVLLLLYMTSLAGSPSIALALTACAIVGATIFPTYALILAHTNDWLPENSLVPAAAALLLINSFGGVFGNFAASWSMGIFGPGTFFLFLSVCNLLFGFFVMERMRRRQKPTGDTAAYDFTPAAPGTIPLGGAFETPEEREEDRLA